MIELSVVIPAYRAATFLPACLDGLARQTAARERFEVLVVDDASPDDGAALAERWGARVLRHEHNLGAAAARNTGAAAAQAGLLLFVDADVIPDEALVASVLALFADRGVDAATGRYAEQPANDTRFARYKALWTWHCWEETAGRTGSSSHLQGALAAVRSEVLRGIGGFDARYEGGNVEDYEVSERLRKAGVAIVFDDRLRGRHHFPDGPTVARNYWDRTRMWVRLRAGSRSFSSGQAQGRSGLAAVAAVCGVSFLALPPLLPLSLLAQGVWLATSAPFLTLALRRGGPRFLAYTTGVHYGLQVIVGLAALSAPFGRGSRGAGATP